MNEKYRLVIKKMFDKQTIGYVLFACILFTGGWIANNELGANDKCSNKEGEVVDSRDYEGIEDDISFIQFWQVWDMVQELYLRQPISEKDMFYGAISGMVDALGDPYSVYFDPEESSAFNEELQGEYSGIGAEIGKKEDYIIIIAPLSDSPAERAGLIAGDYIISVNGEDMIGATVDYAVSRIKGEAGTRVTLTIVREGSDDTIDIPITREDIKINSVEWEFRDDGIMYIRISIFNEDTTSLFRKAAQEALTKEAKGIVLDLRNNPGGLLTEAINVAGFWIDNDTVVQERVGDSVEPFSANGFAWLYNIPTVVLVNGGSASGSEILAGALQDYGLATLIGEQTFGKGSVQEYYEFDDGSALKVTTAEWLTPNGKSIDEVGITPDQVIEYSKEDYETGATPQLDAAISKLKEAW
jgi:carboxyl-terminal processing protease